MSCNGGGCDQPDLGRSLDEELVDPKEEAEQLRLTLADKEREILAIREQLSTTQQVLIQKENQLNKIVNTFGWRMLSRYGPLKHRYVLPAYRWFASVLKRQPRNRVDPNDSYEAWAARSEGFRYNAERAAREIAQLKSNPLISILLPIDDGSCERVTKSTASVLKQYYPNWELCIGLARSTGEAVRRIVEARAAADKRIKVVLCDSDERARVSNHALKLATGEFIATLDADCELTLDALYEVVITLQQTDADLIYSDEDKIDGQGHRSEPFFKPAWSPDLLLSFMYTGRFAFYRKELVERLGGLREGLAGGEAYDLVLRFSEKTDKIIHVPRILFHQSKGVGIQSGAHESQQRALIEALSRRKIDGQIERVAALGYHRVRRAIGGGKVTIIIPTRDRLDLLRRCVNSIESKTEYRNYEIIIVDNGSREARTIEYLKRTHHRVIKEDGRFNFSRLNNLAAQQSDGDYLLLLNNDTEVIAGEWLSAMIEHAQRKEVGAVGAKLLYPNGQIQHAGVILGDSFAGHAHRHADGSDWSGRPDSPNLIRDYTAVTAACLMIRREVFNQVGGLNEHLAVNFNDVDLCLRLRELGYLVVYTPYAVLYHHEFSTRKPRADFEETSFLISRWQRQLISDLYYNPSLSAKKEDFSIDFTKPESFYCVNSQEIFNAPIAEIGARKTAGQEFFSADANLCAIGVKLAIAGDRPHTLRLHVRESHLSDSDLVVAEVDMYKTRDCDWPLFAFDPIRESAGKWFYFFLESVGDNCGKRLSVLGSSATSGVSGPHFQNHAVARGTISFYAYCLRQFR